MAQKDFPRGIDASAPAVRGDCCRLVRGVGWSLRNVQADADDGGIVRLLQQYARYLRALHQHVVWPFQECFACRRQKLLHRVGDGKRGQEAEFGATVSGLTRAQQDRKIKVAQGAEPGMGAPAAPGCLLVRVNDRPVWRARGRHATGDVVRGANPVVAPHRERFRHASPLPSFSHFKPGTVLQAGDAMRRQGPEGSASAEATA